MTRSQGPWTNPSVRQFSKEGDPVQAITELARSVALSAIDDGWSGPPFDPFELAERLGFQTVPRDDLADARIVPDGLQGARIEFNPTRPRGRVRYSVAHEIAHTFFTDWHKSIRNRLPTELGSDNWQLELLCNVAAAELLMPAGTLEEVRHEDVSVERLMALRKEYDVSTEAMFLRFIRLTDQPCMVFAAAREGDSPDAPYRIDYAKPSRKYPQRIISGTLIESSSVLSECTAVGFTAVGTEQWERLSPHQVECVGIPPYPGSRYPRVMGVLRSVESESKDEGVALRIVRGDATQPRGDGRRIIAHIVNDKTPNWGGGFALEVKKKLASVQEDFQRWVSSDGEKLQLRRTHLTKVNDSVFVFSMIAQNGYGPSTRPRIRYAALRACLDQLAKIASAEHASVHMPRIGIGQARGDWSPIETLIDESLLSRGIPVTVYDLPGAELPVTEQLSLGTLL